MGMSHDMQLAMERLKQDLGGRIAQCACRTERVEILAAALYGFSAPIPDYEPTFVTFAGAIEPPRTGRTGWLRRLDKRPRMTESGCKNRAFFAPRHP